MRDSFALVNLFPGCRDLLVRLPACLRACLRIWLGHGRTHLKVPPLLFVLFVLFVLSRLYRAIKHACHENIKTWEREDPSDPSSANITDFWTLDQLEQGGILVLSSTEAGADSETFLLDFSRVIHDAWTFVGKPALITAEGGSVTGRRFFGLTSPRAASRVMAHDRSNLDTRILSIKPILSKNAVALRVIYPLLRMKNL